MFMLANYKFVTYEHSAGFKVAKIPIIVEKSNLSLQKTAHGQAETPGKIQNNYFLVLMDIGHNALQMKGHNVWFQFMYIQI
jgi:hypothetical protein